MPRTGRPRKPLPTTPEAAAADLRRYGVDPVVTEDGRVGLTVADVVLLLYKLMRRRKAPEGSR